MLSFLCLARAIDSRALHAPQSLKQTNDCWKSRMTKASFRLGAQSRAPCSGTKMDIVQTRQCHELKLYINNKALAKTCSD